MNNEQRLYINGTLVDLMPSTPLAYTLQVNDLGDVQNRQTNYTRNIDIPKTPKNLKIFEFLGTVGSDSNLPYRKNVADYYVGNNCLIHQGWANITETTSVYKVHIYDGTIDFFKAIENQTFNEIDLSGITHTKTLAAVTNSWSTDLPYRYILADYGGKLLFDDGIINTDYQTPSVKVSWLWDKIFSTYNIDYSGSIFSTNDFTNLWMTYPKGITSSEDEVLKFESDDLIFPRNSTAPFAPNSKQSIFLKFNSWDTFEMMGQGNNIHLYVPETSYYRIQLNGSVKPRRVFYETLPPPFGETMNIGPQKINLWLCKNGNGSFGGADNLTPIKLLTPLPIGTSTSYSAFTFSVDEVVEFNQGENFCIIARTANPVGNPTLDNLYRIDIEEPIIMNVWKINQTIISFDNALSEFRITDFVKEILWRFGLTIFKDKYSNSYEFLTLEERITNAQVIDWSSKYQSLDSEKYVYGGYAQNNVMRYTYNDPLNNHHDGSIQIANANLEESKDIIKSKIFAPEKFQTTLLPVVSNIYPLWETEVTEEDGEQVLNRCSNSQMI